MTNDARLHCDGCGQLASAEHIARRLQRLEWATRYRPIHIATLLLGAFAPLKDSDFLYTPTGEFSAEGAQVLADRGIEAAGKSRDAVLVEFQRGGFFLTHVLECPLDDVRWSEANIQGLLEARLPSVIARIRRSLKPKKLVAISPLLGSLLKQLRESCNDLLVLES